MSNLSKELSASLSGSEYVLQEENGRFFVTDGLETFLYTFCVPLEEERIIHKSYAETYIKIRLYDRGDFSEIIRVESTKLFSTNTFVSNFGLKVFADFKDSDWKSFFNVLKYFLKDVKPKTTYAVCGWGEDNEYLLYGTLKVMPEDIERVNSTLTVQTTPLSCKLSSEVCSFTSEIISKLCSNKFVSYTMLSYYLLSILKERFYKFARFCPSFALVVIGKTGTGKTSSVMPVMNPISLATCCFEDSLASIRRIFQGNSNGATIVDDFKCSSDSNNQKFEEIIRLAGDITSNGKRVFNQKVDNTVTTGMAVFTGEEAPLLQASSYPRLLLMELEAGSINFDVITKLNSHSDEYISFICGFMQYIMQNSTFDSEFIEKVKEKRTWCRNAYKEEALHARYYEIYSWLSTIWEYLKTYFKLNSVYADFDYEKVLISTIIAQHQRYDIDAVRLFSKTFYELKDANIFNITDYEGLKSGCDFDVCESSDEYFVRSGRVYRKIVTQLQNNNITYPCSEKQLRNELYKQGILTKKNSKLLTIEVKDRNNKSYTGYYLKKHIFKNSGGNLNE